MAAKAPAHLSAEAKKWWNRVVKEFEVDDTAGLMVLQQALEAFDRMRQAQEILAAEGLVIRNEATGMVRAHPAAKIEHDARMALLRYWKALGLDIEPPGPVGRPPGR
ncbi:phage terminase small subunit P27 family [Caldinitratiruptor microaerophilus]|uniref:Phage terminase, small subunit, putative, P27 family n=1 Tax=Caldinitratiruptor microaerophilus TaxID=671077 RepID=A0AA35CII7_9FIRM|nr:phage terminase small subunit P27 family [Caldinitratiruptor microaerophilus]BDG59632.1 hypothetical protein caldi_07220 [Caldinitratiruptor microaerophilus]